MSTVLDVVMSAILDVRELFAWFPRKWAQTLSNDYREDPSYKKNLQRLIEYHRKVEDAKDDPHS